MHGFWNAGVHIKAGRTPLFCSRLRWHWLLLLLVIPMVTTNATGGELRAGVAKVDITNYDAGPVSDPLYAKALVLADDQTTAVLITIDAVSIGEIGTIRNDFLGNIRAALQKHHAIVPANVIVNASHCHGVVSPDVENLTVQAVAAALSHLVPVTAGSGTGHEDRIMENRRLLLKDGSEADVRHAYSLPSNEMVAGIGPVDPEIGVLRLDRTDGRTLAVVYNFACHPIQGVPAKSNTADFPAFASKVIEENTDDGTMAFFVQGCAGDINPAQYKDVHNPRDCEPFGTRLGLGVLRAVRSIRTQPVENLNLLNETMALPRVADSEQRMQRLKSEQERLLKSLRGTSLNFQTFLPLLVQYKVSGDYPSYYSHRYLRDEQLDRNDMLKMDEENRANMDAYLANIQTMEQLTRLQTNLDLLQKHAARTRADGDTPLNVEVVGLRVGDFVLITFPGELTVQIGLNIKKNAPREHTFVAGYTNGYLYYTPTAAQRLNTGYAQEDCDCLVAPEWQKLFEEKVAEILMSL